MQSNFRHFYESLGSRYPEDRTVYNTLSGRIRKDWITHKLQEMPPGSLLDCGCNIGTLSRKWNRGIVYGVDIAHSVLERGRRHSPRTNFFQADVLNLAMIKSDSITNAIACEVIEHLQRPEVFFAQIHRVMKKDGVLLVTSPNFTGQRPYKVSLGILQSYGVTEGTDGIEYLHTAYKPHELAAMAQEAGYTIVLQGSFEFELRGWLKILTLTERVMAELVMRLAPASRMNCMLAAFFRRLEIGLFGMLDVFGFGRLLRHLFKEGRRSYILARK
ncbi:MAG: class I SAM-dependent methyltransferase [candidate division WOR-3 bacterium]|nr:MAG: class I SAM-dependent methyltransferase [candidate division WOR-3 bacterium]